MAREEESFETLVKEAPLAPAAGTVSLVGTLARSAEAGKFVLILQEGRAVTLETAAVNGHMVLGTSVGQTIVRIDVDADKVRPDAEASAGPYRFGSQVPAGAVAPFALATPQQLPPAILAALEFPNAIPAYGPASPLGIVATYPLVDNSLTLPAIDIYLTLPLVDDIHTAPWIDHPGTGGPRLD